MRDPAGQPYGGRGTVFLFPGQGSYDGALLCELRGSYPETAPWFAAADAAARRWLGEPFLPLAAASPPAAERPAPAGASPERQAPAPDPPDIEQLGIYLGGAATARLLMERGARPALLAGHSFGELAALGAAEVFDLAAGFDIVCRRVLALRAAAPAGTMAALSCGAAQAREMLRAGDADGIEIAVLNHPRQTVVSGPRRELEELAAAAAARGISLTYLKSRYPFHSSHLAGAVEGFAAALRECEWRPPRLPVYLAMERRLLEPGLDLPALLASQLTRRLDFAAAVHGMHDAGYRRFLEVGSGEMVGKLVRKNLAAAGGRVMVQVVAPAGGRLAEGIERAVGLAASGWEESAPAGTSGVGAGAGDVAARDEADGAPAPLAGVSLQELALLLREAAERIARAATMLHPIAATGSGLQPFEPCPEMPIAIVGMGCVLPGAGNPEEFWRNLLDGMSGIVDLAEVDPLLGRDFVAGRSGGEIEVVSDKTYTLLNGAIRAVPYDSRRLAGAYDEDTFAALTRGQRLLATALGQGLAGLPVGAAAGPAARMRCIVGATADGSSEHDEALFAASVRRALQAPDLADALPAAPAVTAAADAAAGEPRRALADRLERLLAPAAGDVESLGQHRLYGAVVERLLGRGVPVCVVDAACSSSLYALDLGIAALRGGEADLVVAGGVFAPGPANNALFAQFRGLTATASRPLDAAADGVVFGDGAAVVVLRRLPDALAAGGRVLGVIRGIGLSSDGRSASVNVPQKAGQSLAIRRAYASGLALDSIQLVEAHATATPVGDAVELSSLAEVFAARSRALPPIQLGSVKALIGHTGWVSGVASLIKVLLAFAARTVPPQHNFDSPHPDLEPTAASFEVARRARPWPPNLPPLPRRAGINGFGFGGTNAHLVVEDFDEAYHRLLCRGLARAAEPAPQAPPAVAVVGVAALFPAAGRLAGEEPAAPRRFERSALRLPAGKLLLPDVTDHMDASQYLTALAAERIFGSLPHGWRELAEETGVVVGLAGKTERGVRANERIFLDRLRRLAAESAPAEAGARQEQDRLLEAVAGWLSRRNPPSGPYTLPGLMPNVAASRVSNLFALKGPNLVIDQGDGSLVQALAVGAGMLGRGACRLVLAGGLHAAAEEPAGAEAEGVLLLALARPETAHDLSLPVLATLRLAPPGQAPPPPPRAGGGTAGTTAGAAAAGAPTNGPGRPRWRGAEGIVEVLAALRKARGQRAAANAGELPAGWSLVFEPAASAEAVPGGAAGRAEADAPAPAAAAVPTTMAAPTAAVAPAATVTPAATVAPPAHGARPSTHAYVEGTPIAVYTPVLVPAPATAPAASMAGRKLLLLADQPELVARFAAAGVWSGAACTVVCPASRPVPGALALDLDSPAGLAATAGALRAIDFDTVVAVQRLAPGASRSLLLAPLAEERRLLDLLFTACQQAHGALGRGETSVYTLSLDAFDQGRPHAQTGLFGGFCKALARELPGAAVRSVASDSAEPRRAWRQLALEMGQEAGGAVEVCWRGDRREVFALAPLPAPARGARPCLDERSVVLATAGGRGVTAVLAEELLCRFGCTLIAVGRTDPGAGLPALAGLADAEVAAYEGRFYREELARDPAAKITELKRRFAEHRAAAELQASLSRLCALPGRCEYHTLDLHDEAAVAALVDGIHARHGRLDMVLHGAGIQLSQMLPKKSLADFRRIVATKLGGLGAIYRACRRHAAGRPVHFHLLSSAFSYLGNDGQPDYGAANEAMNRLAAAMDGREDGASWSAMAWLGWAGVGMTRGSEFAALAASRRLRGVTPGEGREIFGRLLAGRPSAPVQVLLAEGERVFYRPLLAPGPADPARVGAAAAVGAAAVGAAPPAAREPPAVAPAPAPAAAALVMPVEIDLAGAPYLREHLVHGVPTLPGALLLGIAAEAAALLRPGLTITAFENTSFRHLVRVYEGRPTRLRLDTRMVEEERGSALVRVQVLEDFVHKSGVVLRRDVVQTEIGIRMAESPPGAPERGKTPELRGGQRLPDPYLLPGSPVRLNGIFKTLDRLAVNGDSRQAHYRLNDISYPGATLAHLLPNVVLVDAFWRFGTVMATGEHTLAVYVPERCDRMGVYFDYTDFDLGWLFEPAIFTGANPRPEGDRLLVGPIEVRDREGRLRLTVEGGVCRKFGELPDAF